jgi:hypothetical protein
MIPVVDGVRFPEWEQNAPAQSEPMRSPVCYGGTTLFVWERSEASGQVRPHSHPECAVWCAEPDSRGKCGAWIRPARPQIAPCQAAPPHSKSDQQIEGEPHTLLDSACACVGDRHFVCVLICCNEQANMSPVLGCGHYPPRNKGLLTFDKVVTRRSKRFQRIPLWGKRCQRFGYVINRIFGYCI